MSTNINDLFPSRWLKAADLKGREPVLTIRKVAYEPVGQAKTMKAIVYFERVEKGLVLNKTNATRIVQIAGSGVIEEWVGVQIKLYSTQVEFQGDLTDAIRIRPVTASKHNPLRPAEALPTAKRQEPDTPMPTQDPFADSPASDADEGPLTSDDIPF